MTNWIATIFASALESIPKSNSKGHNSFSAVLLSVARAPIKAIAAFVFAPILVFRVAAIATDSKRKWIAATGLFLAAILSLAAGTFLGSVAGAFIVNTLFGPWIAVGFFIGTAFSILLTVTFQVIVLNATCFLFLGLSLQEVVDYLKNTSE